MGLPGFFLWLMKQHNNKLIYPKLSIIPDILLLDANCLFHQQCKDIMDKYPLRI